MILIVIGSSPPEAGPMETSGGRVPWRLRSIQLVRVVPYWNTCVVSAVDAAFLLKVRVTSDPERDNSGRIQS